MRRAWFLALGLAAVAACGRSGERHNTTSLTFETLSDTTGLGLGAPLLTAFEPYRLPTGQVRARGVARFPDGTRLQISILRESDQSVVMRMQVPVMGGRFDSPPVMGEKGPLAEGGYAFDVLARFDDDWQPPQVMIASDRGRALHGPGMGRDRDGVPEFHVVRRGRV
ncbi:MAG: hypothetical protein ACRENS_11165 [Candidatus Eiseniibacteriota bacterium]